MSQISTRQDDVPFGVMLLYLFTGLAAFAALFGAAFTQDRLFRFHSYVAFAGSCSASW